MDRASGTAAARDALLDPWTWGPVLAATAFQIDGWDRRVSDWARRETPIFGSTAGAHFPSDTLLGAALGNFVASFFNDALLGPVGSTARIGVTASQEGLLVSWQAAF